ncbi:hypothetical protein AMATHDRAFT_43713 [Amanita thiersii Skay4041]|uniref:F-box domain-containing protein n=1 Tax=Amanita thiersii Skay4041 TaxID=703135 RepID=A0A2A9N8P6_9AGAR|nr:hypothetical protein AMATHDRAFT_43713 [Amanita thiersii Skay4041]
MCQDIAQVAQIDAQIRQFQLAVEILQQERKRLNASLTYHLNTRPSPIRDIPVEILQEIFLYLLPPVLEMRNCTALRLSHVCSQWRLILHSMSHVWSSVNINCDCASHQSWSGPEFLRHCVKLSGERPLSIVLRASNVPEAQLQSLMSDILTPTFHRWKHVDLNVHLHPWLARLHELTFDELESLSIAEPMTTAHGPCVDLSRCPKLSRLVLCGIKYPTSKFTLPWSGIRVFEACDVFYSPEEYSSILKCMTNLTELKIVCTSRLVDSAEAGSVVLPHLASFSFIAPKAIASAYLNPLVLPSLRKFSFKVDHSSMNPVELADQLVRLIMHCHRSLEDLKLAGLCGLAVLRVLNRTPNLVRLQCRFVALYMMDFFARFGEVELSRLERVEFRLRPVSLGQVGGLRRWVERKKVGGIRWGGGESVLKEVMVKFPHGCCESRDLMLGDVENYDGSGGVKVKVDWVPFTDLM